MKKTNYLEPFFPQKAYMLLLFLYQYGKAQGLIPLAGIYEDYKEATKIAKTIYDEAKKEDQDIPDHGILLPLTFSSKVPLVKKYWDNPKLHLGSWDRIHLFLKVLKNPTLHHILVVPIYIDSKGKQMLEATIPVNPENPATIERFMLNSDQTVDIRAKNAAIYHAEETMRINWRTNKIEPLNLNYNNQN